MCGEGKKKNLTPRGGLIFLFFIFYFFGEGGGKLLSSARKLPEADRDPEESAGGSWRRIFSPLHTLSDELDFSEVFHISFHIFPLSILTKRSCTGKISLSSVAPSHSSSDGFWGMSLLCIVSCCLFLAGFY